MVTRQRQILVIHEHFEILLVDDFSYKASAAMIAAAESPQQVVVHGRTVKHPSVVYDEVMFRLAA